MSAPQKSIKNILHQDDCIIQVSLSNLYIYILLMFAISAWLFSDDYSL